MGGRIHGPQWLGWWDGRAAPTITTVSAITWQCVSLTFTASGRVAGMAAYMGSGVPVPYIGILWDSTSGALLGVTRFKGTFPGGSGRWWRAFFRPYARVATSDTYRFGVLRGQDLFRTTGVLASPVTNNHMTWINGFTTTNQWPPSVASPLFGNNAAGIDLLFIPD